MDLELPTVVGILAIVLAFVAAVLGFLFDRRNAQSAIMLGGYAAVAGLICTLGALAGRWPGLLIAVVVVAIVAYRVASAMGNRQGGFFAAGLWLGWCLSCIVGYWGGGWLGLLLITVPTWILFWGTLFVIAHMLLPLRHRGGKIGPLDLPRGLRPTEKPQDKGDAFRSLVTFSLGTNYPYLALEHDEMVERVKGKLVGQFLGGPGVVLTGPAHAPVIWTGTDFTNIGGPGVTFTRRLERVFQTLDLRPQLRTFFVEATTRDGIRIRTQVFCPFQLETGRQLPSLGQAFPRRRKIIDTVTRQQSVGGGRRLLWDEGVTATADRILCNLLAEYRLDQLAEAPEPFDAEQRNEQVEARAPEPSRAGKSDDRIQAEAPKPPNAEKGNEQVEADSPSVHKDNRAQLDRDADQLAKWLSAPENERAQLTQSLGQIAESPAAREDVRTQIAQRLERQLAEELQPLGIHILGVGLGVLEPVDRSLVEKRVEAWRAQWERQILITQGETRRQEIDQVERAYRDTQVELLTKISDFVKSNQGMGPELLPQMTALRFVEALEEMAQQPEIGQSVPKDTGETLAHLRRRLSQE